MHSDVLKCQAHQKILIRGFFWNKNKAVRNRSTVCLISCVHRSNCSANKTKKKKKNLHVISPSRPQTVIEAVTADPQPWLTFILNIVPDHLSVGFNITAFSMRFDKTQKCSSPHRSDYKPEEGSVWTQTRFRCKHAAVDPDPTLILIRLDHWL